MDNVKLMYKSCPFEQGMRLALRLYSHARIFVFTLRPLVVEYLSTLLMDVTRDTLNGSQ